MFTSWKTSTGGIALIFFAISQGIWYLLDNDPATTADLDLIASQIVAGLALIFARDYNVHK